MDPVSENDGQTYYRNREPGSVLACQHQIELCNPSLRAKSCIIWDNIPEIGWFDSGFDTLTPLNLSEVQRTETVELAASLYDSSFGNVVLNLADKILVASEYMGAGSDVSPILPIDQWIIELQNIQAVSLATMQRRAYDSAVPVNDPFLRSLHRQTAVHDVQTRKSKAELTPHSAC